MHRALTSAALMSHVRLWCPELPFTPGGQVCPCYSLVNMTTAIQAAWLAAGLSLLPPCPHRGQLSQQQCSTQGTWPHAPIAAVPGVSEGLGGTLDQEGTCTSLDTGEAAPSSAYAFMSFLQVAACPCALRSWCYPLAAPVPSKAASLQKAPLGACPA